MNNTSLTARAMTWPAGDTWISWSRAQLIQGPALAADVLRDPGAGEGVEPSGVAAYGDGPCGVDDEPLQVENAVAGRPGAGSVRRYSARQGACSTAAVMPCA